MEGGVYYIIYSMNCVLVENWREGVKKMKIKKKKLKKLMAQCMVASIATTTMTSIMSPLSVMAEENSPSVSISDSSTDLLKGDPLNKLVNENQTSVPLTPDTLSSSDSPAVQNEFKKDTEESSSESIEGASDIDLSTKEGESEGKEHTTDSSSVAKKTMMKKKRRTYPPIN